MNFSKYIGIPYKHKGSEFNGCDCFGLCRLIFKEERGIILPSFSTIYNESWYKDNCNHIVDNIKQEFGFYKTNPPFKLYDGLIFYHGSNTIANHIGLWIGNNKFIHVYEDMSSIVDRFDGYWKNKFYGACRYICPK